MFAADKGKPFQGPRPPTSGGVDGDHGRIETGTAFVVVRFSYRLGNQSDPRFGDMLIDSFTFSRHRLS